MDLLQLYDPLLGTWGPSFTKQTTNHTGMYAWTMRLNSSAEQLTNKLSKWITNCIETLQAPNFFCFFFFFFFFFFLFFFFFFFNFFFELRMKDHPVSLILTISHYPPPLVLLTPQINLTPPVSHLRR
jgi:Na+/melibiose symporter-like transporter